MHFFTFLATFVSLFTFVVADNYANFFDDDNCKVNGGIGVNINNDGCLSQSGRGSVYIPRGLTPSKNMCLVATKGSSKCNCQNDGYNFTPTGFCHKLDKSMKSYRFIEEACGHDNC